MKNIVVIYPNYCKVFTTNLKDCFLIDRESYSDICAFTWHVVAKKGKTVGTIRKYAEAGIPGTKKKIILHRYLMCAPDDLFVDHKNGDGLDDRLDNLRLCTRTQNNQNQHSRFGTSEYKGVSRSQINSVSQWMARIRINGKLKYICSSSSEEYCAMMYDVEAIKNFGEFANTNFPKKIVMSVIHRLQEIQDLKKEIDGIIENIIK